MIFTDLLKSIVQFNDPKFRRVLWLTLALLITTCSLIAIGLNQFLQSPYVVSLIGEASLSRNLLNMGGVLSTFVLSIWLMGPIASTIISLFLDEVARAVEARHYPHLPEVQGTRLHKQILTTVSFFGVLILANLGALILSIFLPVLAPFIFWATNGYLLGREYFQMASIRRINQNEAKLLFQRNRGTIWFTGILIAIPLSVPFVGLIIPVLGAATFTHQFERLQELPSD